MKADGLFLGSVFSVALALGGGVNPALAQDGATASPPALTEKQQAFEHELRSELVCVCGNCPHLTLTTCTCPVADTMRHQLATQVAFGKDREGIYQYFINTYGSQEPLGAPIGAFNQLVWLFPFALGGAALVLIGGAVVRSSRRSRTSRESPERAFADDVDDELLTARLDDELRNLD